MCLGVCAIDFWRWGTCTCTHMYIEYSRSWVVSTGGTRTHTERDRERERERERERHVGLTSLATSTLTYKRCKISLHILSWGNTTKCEGGQLNSAFRMSIVKPGDRSWPFASWPRNGTVGYSCYGKHVYTKDELSATFHSRVQACTRRKDIQTQTNRETEDNTPGLVEWS